jgi:hypothetical protein
VVSARKDIIWSQPQNENTGIFPQDVGKNRHGVLPNVMIETSLLFEEFPAVLNVLPVFRYLLYMQSYSHPAKEPE